MARLKSRSVFIHVDLPGQGYDAPDLPQNFEFPSLDKIAADLLAVLDHFKYFCFADHDILNCCKLFNRVKYCITLGEGAGANILLRFSMAHPERILGNILIHCVANVESMAKYVSEKIMSWKLSSLGMNSAADQYLVYHRFGMVRRGKVVFNVQQRSNFCNQYLDSKKDLDHEKAVNRFLERLHKRMNPKNLRLYVDTYLA